MVHTDQGIHYQHSSWSELIASVDDYIVWYNNRLQQRLKGLTPMQYRNQTLDALIA
ncbi:transposase-like protein [Corynebacterium pilosum]|uniref:Transposase-like protein n=1 Tax=Corynebacterium pilosum TaxID=35756 RepID=A0A376CLM1_9CORY|nr:transposase-like protein [Corynebacterium pilosum]